ncbi:IS200/IS605 family transposase [Candidatus Gottesmanbacteria bacterium]|nr:IS200/IS605 family transposase [Candidatus Gottesmanbacteria bacterium]
MEMRRQAHVVYRCQYHIVWIPRYRYNVLVDGVKEYLLIKLDEVRKYYPEVEYVERNIQKDHVHVVISFPPRHSIAKVVQVMKQNTGKALKEKFDYLKRLYWRDGGIWSVGYFVSTVGLDEAMIQRYVRYQEKEDAGQAKLVF